MLLLVKAGFAAAGWYSPAAPRKAANWTVLPRGASIQKLPMVLSQVE